ncbi:CTB family bacteriocin [Calothrix sp. PCC 7507]|uniref:CTB family bacteriocin n=1 Tax=Calothrix sp. PCC 7507 TaxID=99598 RepID=UPI00029F49F8|nr:CTB family bacteriocin [Calothrix sp. PCC 7507]AFY34453.1 hypothetical protein Cal7507_4069 [Calothrix sp. PCC 7507]
MSVENQTAIELSEEELDVVAGGADVLFDLTHFNSNTLLVAQNTQSGVAGSSTSSTIARQVIDTTAVHFVGLGL